MNNIRVEKAKSTTQIFLNPYKSKNSKISNRMININNANIYTQLESYLQTNFNKEDKSHCKNGTK